jgi:hypothetical protein
VSFVIDNLQQEPYVSIADERKDLYNLSDPNTRDMDFYETFLHLAPGANKGSLQVVFRSIDNTLVRTDIELFVSASWLDDNPFVLSELLNTYGTPTHVYMQYLSASVMAYVLVAVYEDNGIMVKYYFGSNTPSDERVTEEGRMMICSEDDTHDLIEITLQSPDNPTSIIEPLRPELDDESVYYPFWDIEDMTGLSVEAFTAAFANNPEACIEAYSLSELREQGYD